MSDNESSGWLRVFDSNLKRVGAVLGILATVVTLTFVVWDRVTDGPDLAVTGAWVTRIDQVRGLPENGEELDPEQS